ncbi:MAG: hypothetical protein ACR2P5_06760 [Gammaproteobacteria bacterium]
MAKPLGESFARGLKGTAQPSGYPNNWAKISAAFRKERKYTCEVCSVKCGADANLANTGLTEAHHINGDKSDCKYANLQCLCVYCHSQQPSHEHYKAPEKKMEKLRQLWEEQGIPEHLRGK